MKRVVKVTEKLFNSDITGATYIVYREIVGFQLNGSNDGILLDSLPALR